MTLRNRFQFMFTAGELIVAAQARVDHHRTKVEWWTAERTQAAARAPDDAPSSSRIELTVRMDGSPVDVAGDQQYIATCDSKIQSHTTRASNYERWARAFTTVKHEQPFTLDVDDVAYFGL